MAWERRYSGPVVVLPEEPPPPRSLADWLRKIAGAVNEAHVSSIEIDAHNRLRGKDREAIALAAEQRRRQLGGAK